MRGPLELGTRHAGQQHPVLGEEDLETLLGCCPSPDARRSIWAVHGGEKIGLQGYQPLGEKQSLPPWASCCYAPQVPGQLP